MHYGADELLMPWGFGPRSGLRFPERTVGYFPDGKVERALDIGCAVGCSSFELSKRADEVVGVDYSSSFIAAARRLVGGGVLEYTVRQTGRVESRALAQLPDGSRPGCCRFLTGDAMDLPAGLGLFDRVHAANLICRLSHPAKLLDRLPGLVKPGGFLVLATPCTWLDAFTPPDQQPAGETFDWLRSKLGGAFSLVSQSDEPFLIRETARKFQWSVSMVTLWQRNDEGVTSHR